MIRQIIQYISVVISKIIPTTNILVFTSFPDFTDNTYAVYKYIIEHRQKYSIKK